MQYVVDLYIRYIFSGDHVYFLIPFRVEWNHSVELIYLKIGEIREIF